MQTFNIPEKVNAIIFDIDSTLYTNEAYAFEQIDVQVRHYAEIKNITPKVARGNVAEYRSMWSKTHNGEKISLAKTLQAFGISTEESIQWRKDLIHPENFLKEDIALRYQLEDIQKKCKTICVTNNPVITARKTLEVIGISDIFPTIIGLDTCGVSKPNEKPFLLALQNLNEKPEHCVSVGDRYDIDIAVPLKLGMGGILVKNSADIGQVKKICFV